MGSENALIPKRYDIDLKIDTEKGELEAEVVFIVDVRSGRSLEFDLHETFEIEELKVNGSDLDYLTEENEPTPVDPASKKVKVQDWQGEGEVEVEISYSGRLKDIPEFETMEDQEFGLDDRIEPEHVELASYSRWYPSFGYGPSFYIDLDLNIPDDLVSVCSGKKLSSEVEDGRRAERWEASRDNDIVVVASSDFKKQTINGSFGEFSVYYTRLPDGFIRREMEEIGEAIELYQEMLGRSHLSGGTFKNVYSPKEKGQGAFSRNGLIVYSEGYILGKLDEDPELSLFKWNAHEIAHFWWNIGSGQGDWINEAFAEYFSDLAVEDIISKERLEEYLGRYEELVKELPDDAPSISEVEPYNSGINYTIRYYKAPLMLHELRGWLGRERFIEESKNFYEEYKETGVTTSDFVSFWSAVIDDKEKIDSMERWLTSEGGLP